ncbi:hypothetical protein A5881_003612 [Enterococcus termitis]
MNIKIGKGVAHASFGELLQGRLPENDRSFLVTLPIDMFAKATFYPNPNKPEIIIIPDYKKKALKAINILKKSIENDLGGTVYVDSNIPECKGLSSSSADLVAAVRAFADSINYAISNEEIGHIMAQIEPSDAVMYDSTVVFYNCEGVRGEYVPKLPNFTIVGVDDGGMVNTEDCYKSLNKRDLRIFEKHEKLLEEFVAAAEKNDIWEIGRISTESSILNQEILFKKSLDKLLSVKEECKLPGIVTSHTGTYIGLIVNHDKNYLDNMNKVTEKLIENDFNFSIFNTI